MHIGSDDMTANTWFYIGIVSFVIAVAFAILSVILFFKLNIKEVLNDLTGKTAAVGIQSIREETKSKEKKRFTASVNTAVVNNKITETLRTIGDETATSLLQEGDESATTMLQLGDESSTTLLQQGDESVTTLLQEGDESVTTLLQEGDESATTLLQQGEESVTTLLEPEDEKEVQVVVENTIIVHG